jgi:hypothetical protein
MSSLDFETNTLTYHLVDVPSYMEGEAKHAIEQILIQSLEVNFIEERGECAAKLFTSWYHNGVLNEHLYCKKSHAEFYKETLDMIEDAIESIAKDWMIIGARALQEDTEYLQDHYAWVKDPKKYMSKFNNDK